MKPLYTATATATGGREGRTHTDDGKLDVKLSMPKDLGGPGGDGTNPEQLFAAGYAACFESALRMVARLQKQSIPALAITSKVSLNKTEEGKFALSVELHGKFSDVPRDVATALMNAAHGVCPYSAATRGNIDVQLFVDD